MPIYATKADALAIYGESIVAGAVDPDGEGVLEDDALNKALEEASKDIEGYPLRAGDTLPTLAADAPGWWRIACIDIALYIAAADGSRIQEEKKARADYWRNLLSSQYPLTNKSGNPVSSSSGNTKFSSHDREFTAEKQIGL